MTELGSRTCERTILLSFSQKTTTTTTTTTKYVGGGSGDCGGSGGGFSERRIERERKKKGKRIVRSKQVVRPGQCIPYNNLGMGQWVPRRI
ncbi:hypothetical protein M0804_001460 [Polistes exclamans]|nr:hypothetical protein M0804_001460 [Polistes exclamans]